MFITDHARMRLERRLGLALADRITDKLDALKGEPGDVAIEVYRMPAQPGQRYRIPVGPGESNGDQVIVIARDGSVETVMLRRSWNQPFTPAALSVQRCTRLVLA